jgi:hypothetical protein
VVFNVNDPIFELENRIPVDESEQKEDWSRCNCCGDSDLRKLRSCFFCGDLHCPRCLFKTRPYPSESNKDRSSRGDICITCNKKFLYRDAMYELMAKLEMKDNRKKQFAMALTREEYKYDNIVSNLSRA